VLAAYHRASGRLYVLMHEGPHWSYAQEATEIWVVDLNTQKVLNRFEIPQAAGRLAVTQDAQPLLCAISAEYLWALNADSGEVLRTTRVDNSSLVGVKDF
jgi:methylamine dehydrogenase heavy chain